MEKEINLIVGVKQDDVSYEEIQELLCLAHETNEQKGLLYATAKQSVATLVEKIGKGVCFTVQKRLPDGSKMLVGVCALEERTLKYWYVGSVPQRVLLLKLVGVHPECRGNNIGRVLFEKCVEYGGGGRYKLIVTDSAEENIAYQKLTERFGFLAVDYCKYAANNFISAVYAKWLDNDCPWSEETRKARLAARRKEITERREERP